jgi:hypothetical protein
MIPAGDDELTWPRYVFYARGQAVAVFADGLALTRRRVPMRFEMRRAVRWCIGASKRISEPRCGERSKLHSVAKSVATPSPRYK